MKTHNGLLRISCVLKWFVIPNNDKNHFDIIYKNILFKDKDKINDVGVVFKEKLKNNKIIFISKVMEIGNLAKFMANKVVDCQDKIVNNESDLEIFIKKQS